MLTIEQARRFSDDAPDIVELLREFEEVDRNYREVVAAMCTGEDEIAPVRNSAEVTLSFQSTDVTLDLSRT